MSTVLDELGKALPPGFSIDSFLKGGGQGVVCRGMCNGQEAALKFFDPQNDPRRLEREIAALQSIDSPHVVRVLGSCEIHLKGQPVTVVAYELLHGGDLSVRIGTVPDVDILRGMGTEVSTALQILWSKRIVHRDIKPENIMQASDDRFVVVDLGLARHLDRSNLTIGGNPGTPGFMSPEQARGARTLTISSDVFSLGVTLYQIATGVHPFNGLQRAIGTTTPQPLGQHRPDLPKDFCVLVHQMMSTLQFTRPTRSADRFAALK